MERARELDILDRVMAHRAAGNTTDMAPEMYANPVDTYVDADRYEREVERLFRGCPIVACLTSDVAAARRLRHALDHRRARAGRPRRRRGRTGVPQRVPPPRGDRGGRARQRRPLVHVPLPRLVLPARRAAREPDAPGRLRRPRPGRLRAGGDGVRRGRRASSSSTSTALRARSTPASGSASSVPSSPQFDVAGLLPPRDPQQPPRHELEADGRHVLRAVPPAPPPPRDVRGGDPVRQLPLRRVRPARADGHTQLLDRGARSPTAPRVAALPPRHHQLHDPPEHHPARAAGPRRALPAPAGRTRATRSPGPASTAPKPAPDEPTRHRADQGVRHDPRRHRPRGLRDVRADAAVVRLGRATRAAVRAQRARPDPLPPVHRGAAAPAGRP